MALSAFGILIVISVLGLAVLITRKSPKARELLMKIKNTIFWNFLIRYFQASFIGFNFAALSAVQKKGGGHEDLGLSVLILVVQYVIVAYIGYLIFRKDLQELNRISVRSKMGNLYYNLDTKRRYKVLFGLLFFVQRCLLVALLARKYDFGIQWQFFLVVILLYTAYLIVAEPYSDRSSRTLDRINCFFLMLISALITTYSAWNTEPIDRFTYGMLFDVIVGINFIVNIVFVTG